MIQPPLVMMDHMRISVTYYCNLHCEHCYVPVDYRDQYKKLLEPSQLSVPELESFVDTLVERHFLRKLSVTGGEPLLRVVWNRTSALLRKANEHKLEVQINTGGMAQVPIADVVGIFDDPRKLLFQFSLDGAKKETVESFRNRKGVFESALSQMKQAVELGANVQARMTANRHNIAEAQDAYRLVADLGVDSFKIKPMFAAGVAIDNADAILGDPNEVRDLQDSLITLARGRKTRLELPPPVLVATEDYVGENVKFIGCNCGISSGYLSTNGDLYPCSYIFGDPVSEQFRVGNIRDEGFDLARVWSTSPALKNYKTNSGCAQCPSQDALMKNVENRALACV